MILMLILFSLSSRERLRLGGGGLGRWGRTGLGSQMGSVNTYVSTKFIGFKRELDAIVVNEMCNYAVRRPQVVDNILHSFQIF